MNLREWWHDWRERRAVLAEMDRLRHKDEALLKGLNQNPLNLAKLSGTSGDQAEAALQWERARQLMPNTVVESDDSLDILIGLERYDEAEALMRERRRRFPHDRFCLTGLARVAESRGDYPEAVKRWSVVRQRVRDSNLGYLGCARCLMRLERLDEADTQLSRAIRLDPRSNDAKIALARISERKKDWPQALERWKRLAEIDRNPSAFASAAKAMVEMGRIDEADDWLTEPAKIFTTNFDIAMERCDLAQRRGDVAAACDRWAKVRAINPNFAPAYRNGAQRLLEVERPADAETVLREAIERFPNEAWTLQDFALIAHKRQDWDEAAARWEALRQRFPEEKAGFTFGAQALEAAGRGEEAADLRRAS